MIMIQASHVKFNYARKNVVFDDLTLRLPGGHIHGLLGCNGVGKTTLLKLCSGLLNPNGGTLTVAGSVPGRRTRELLSEMIYVPEEFDLPAISPARFAATTGAFYPDYSRHEFDRYCKELAVNPGKRLDRLSMGQRKKAFLAFALACNVPILLLDEPTNGLDIPSKGVFRRLLAAYAGAERTVVLSTHQVRDVEPLIDYVTILDGQGVVLSASLQALTERFLFGADLPDAIYSEQSLGRIMGIGPNRTGSESRLDLELLFNATVYNRDDIKKQLANKANDHA